MPFTLVVLGIGLYCQGWGRQAGLTHLRKLTNHTLGNWLRLCWAVPSDHGGIPFIGWLTQEWPYREKHHYTQGGESLIRELGLYHVTMSVVVLGISGFCCWNIQCTLFSGKNFDIVPWFNCVFLLPLSAAEFSCVYLFAPVLCTCVDHLAQLVWLTAGSPSRRENY